jgi:hypothetical protein
LVIEEELPLEEDSDFEEQVPPAKNSAPLPTKSTKSIQGVKTKEKAAPKELQSPAVPKKSSKHVPKKSTKSVQPVKPCSAVLQQWMPNHLPRAKLLNEFQEQHIQVVPFRYCRVLSFPFEAPFIHFLCLCWYRNSLRNGFIFR